MWMAILPRFWGKNGFLSIYLKHCPKVEVRGAPHRPKLAGAPFWVPRPKSRKSPFAWLDRFRGLPLLGSLRHPIPHQGSHRRLQWHTFRCVNCRVPQHAVTYRHWGLKWGPKRPKITIGATEMTTTGPNQLEKYFLGRKWKKEITI